VKIEMLMSCLHRIDTSAKLLTGAATYTEEIAEEIAESTTKIRKGYKSLTVKVTLIATLIALTIGTAAGATTWHILKAHYIRSKAIQIYEPETAEAVIRALL
jgi:predicted O-methyltransferase YrrM